jgi:carbon monoxide dehydrogenase subunit G
MDLEHSFIIPVPPEQAWQALLDVEQVAPCMPGATVDDFDGEVISGKIKSKVGPVQMTYAGKARFTEKDEATKTVVLEASGKETRGSGTASATIRSSLQDENGQTRVLVRTTMTVTGRPAQFGRGVMAEVGGRIIGKFASNLATQLSGEGAAATGAASTGRAQAAPATAAGPWVLPPRAREPRPPPLTPGTRAGERLAADAAELPIEELNPPVRLVQQPAARGCTRPAAPPPARRRNCSRHRRPRPQSIKEIKSFCRPRAALTTPGVTADEAGRGSARLHRPRASGRRPAGTRPAAVGPGARNRDWGRRLRATAGPLGRERPAAARGAPAQDGTPLGLLSVAPCRCSRIAPSGPAAVAVVLSASRRRRRPRPGAPPGPRQPPSQHQPPPPQPRQHRPSQHPPRPSRPRPRSGPGPRTWTRRTRWPGSGTASYRSSPA